jgi:hypothetical protein
VPSAGETRAESAIVRDSEPGVDEGTERRIFTKVRGLDFCKVNDVKVEADQSEPDWQLKRVEPAPEAREIMNSGVHQQY